MRKFLFLIIYYFISSSIALFGQNQSHPRIYITDNEKAVFIKNLEQTEWKKEFVKKKQSNLEKYLQYCKADSNWLVSRLQMNWQTKHDKVFLDEGDFLKSEGTAPVPTVRFSGTRDWATDYRRPKLEEVEPYFDDSRGFYLKHKKTGEKEWVHPSETGHIIERINEQIMSLAADAAFLYWLTGEQRYAEFATPVFFTYMEGMYHRDAPIDVTNSNQQRISGLATFEVIHERIVHSLATTYDFLYNYFIENNYSLNNSIAVFQKWGDQIIKNGIPDNNWNLFQARFLTYLALALDGNSNYKNGKGREYFLDHTFTISTERQLAIEESLLVYDQETGIWPESPSYSTHVITTLLRILTLLDHTTNNNELTSFPIIEKAVLSSFQYLFPNGYTVGFGDTHHKILPPENFELLITNYRKYQKDDEAKLMSDLLTKMISDDLYTRRASNFFELFFYVDSLENNTNDPKENSLKQLVTPTFYAPNVSMFNQRIGKGDHAIMVSTVGSFGNHAHANGISIELFANNYALGPDMGKGSSYWHQDHRAFYSRFPAHNTVVVDGKSDYNAMRSYHPFKLKNSYPTSDEIPLFDKVTFSNVSFLEPKTGADQQRMTALIKSNSSTTNAYVLDVFRSKKQNGGQQKHEYIYHNIGQSLTLSDAKGNLLELSPTDELNSTKGDLKGYDYFTDKQMAVSSEDIIALFKLECKGQPNNLMKAWIKGSEKQSIFALESPKSNAITKGTAPPEILEKSLPTFILRRETAAWQNPFAIVFNPYLEGSTNPITKVTFSDLKKYPNTQIIGVLLNDQKTSDKIILNATEGDLAVNDSFYQKGLLSITRSSEANEKFDFLFLAGMTVFEKGDWKVVAASHPFTCSIEKTENGYLIQNDQPITISMPQPEEEQSVEIRFYENEELIITRTANKNRGKAAQLTFRIEKAYDRIEVISLKRQAALERP